MEQVVELFDQKLGEIEEIYLAEIRMLNNEHKSEIQSLISDHKTEYLLQEDEFDTKELRHARAMIDLHEEVEGLTEELQKSEEENKILRESHLQQSERAQMETNYRAEIGRIKNEHQMELSRARTLHMTVMSSVRAQVLAGANQIQNASELQASGLGHIENAAKLLHVVETVIGTPQPDNSN